MESDTDLEKINFGKILAERKILCVLFPDHLEISYQLFSYIAGWKDLFQSFYFCFSEHLLAFFEHLSFSEHTEFVLHHNFVPCENAVLFNFLTDSHFQEDISACRQTIIADLGQEFNLKFSPAPKSEMQLLERFAQTFSYPLQKQSLELKSSKSPTVLDDNKGFHIVLDLEEPKFTKYYESIIKMVKNDWNANFYLTRTPYEQDAFIHVKNMKLNDVYQLCKAASDADLFVTDDDSLLIILKKYIKNALFFGKEGTFSDIPCLHPKNIFELKNLIQEIFDKKRSL